MLVLLPRSGISGDMLLCALIDLGADEAKIASFIKRELNVKLRTARVMNGGMSGRRLLLPELNKEYSPGEMKAIIEKSSLPPSAKKLAHRALQTLVEAEKRMHESEHVHFHELANVDTLVDIMGCAFALELLGEKEVLILPLEVGRIQPAALDILTRHKVPFYSTTDSHELTTPTGAALASVIAKPISGIPKLVSEKAGCGAGTLKRKGGEPNVLRIIMGGAPDNVEGIVMLETNIDDVSGEVLAYAAERLLEEGAKDACLIPIIAKKGRPGAILRAICSQESKGRFASIIFEETGTLGIREIECFRHVASRSTVEAMTREGETVRVKVSKISGRTISSKPEFEDIKRIARKKGKPIREISKGLR